MTKEQIKAHKIRLKTHSYVFEPIHSPNEQSKPPSPFQTGLRYLKYFGQIKRQNEHLNRLERTSAYLTNYYAPLSSASISSDLINKSIQVNDDDYDDLSYKTAKMNLSYRFFYEFLFSLISLLTFICILFLIQYKSYPIYCLLHKRYWYPYDISNGFQCMNTTIQIHYIEISSIIYQIEIEKNPYAKNCLGFEILSCLPTDYYLVPKTQIIRRNNQFLKYCKHPKKFQCQNELLTILPYEYKWNFKNKYSYPLNHCSCLNNKNCFHFMMNYQCDLQIPWIDYCLKSSKTQSICQAYIHS